MSEARSSAFACFIAGGVPLPLPVDVDDLNRTAALGRPARAVCAGRAAGRASILAVCAARHLREGVARGPGDVPPVPILP